MVAIVWGALPGFASIDHTRTAASGTFVGRGTGLMFERPPSVGVVCCWIRFESSSTQRKPRSW